jgi:DNA-binding response OmpR family regulator
VSRISTLARTFDEPFQRALAKSPALRPESCRAFISQLRRASLGTDADGVALRILVVDDDGDQRAQLAETLALRLRGAVIESAPDGESALDAISRKPSVAILDLSMPGLCGIPLIRRVRAIAPHTAIIVVTGHGSGAEWREARELGVKRFYVKPVEPPELARAVRELADEAA